MAALISWVCRADHAVKKADEPVRTLTIHRGQWAYCSRGEIDGCVWEAIPPTSIEQLHPVRRPSETTAEQRVQGAE